MTFHDAILGVQRAQEAMRDENSARTQTLMGLPVHVPAEDIVGALQLLPAERDRLDTYERTLIESALDSGMSWSELATALGRSSRQAMQQRYRRVGGTRTWPTRRSGAAQDG